MKRAIVTIESDGTPMGTQISLDGKVLDGVTSIDWHLESEGAGRLRLTLNRFHVKLDGVEISRLRLIGDLLCDVRCRGAPWDGERCIRTAGHGGECRLQNGFQWEPPSAEKCGANFHYDESSSVECALPFGHPGSHRGGSWTWPPAPCGARHWYAPTAVAECELPYGHAGKHESGDQSWGDAAAGPDSGRCQGEPWDGERCVRPAGHSGECEGRRA